MAETVSHVDVEVKIRSYVVGDDGAVLSKEFTYSKRITDGTGNNQCETVFADGARALAATNEDLDLSGSSSYKDFQGVALAMVQMGLYYCANLDTDTGDTVTVTRPASNGVTGMFVAAGDGVIVQPGGLFLWVAPGPDKATVTAGTADLINVAAADNSTYDLFIAGDKT